MRYIIIIGNITLLLLLSGCNKTSITRKRIGQNIVEAKFGKNSLINGTAKFYDLQDRLQSKAIFTEGVKNGIATTYYENGRIMDSMHYKNDLLNGDSYRYDSNGTLLLKRTNFYGLDVGDHYFYSKGKVQHFYSTNFEKTILIECEYDSLGRCQSLYFKATPSINASFSEGHLPQLDMFIFFPHPPGFDVKYVIGTLDDQGTIKQRIILNSARPFLDTILPKLPQRKSYFISIDYKNLINDSLVNMYYKEFKP